MLNFIESRLKDKENTRFLNYICIVMVVLAPINFANFFLSIKRLEHIPESLFLVSVGTLGLFVYNFIHATYSFCKITEPQSKRTTKFKSFKMEKSSNYDNTKERQVFYCIFYMLLFWGSILLIFRGIYLLNFKTIPILQGYTFMMFTGLNLIALYYCLRLHLLLKKKLLVKESIGSIRKIKTFFSWALFIAGLIMFLIGGIVTFINVSGLFATTKIILLMLIPLHFLCLNIVCISYLYTKSHNGKTLNL